ncbi:hypothetical protein BJY59DRAFT_704491 [Rhodotorula toruloides]
MLRSPVHQQAVQSARCERGSQSEWAEEEECRGAGDSSAERMTEPSEPAPAAWWWPGEPCECRCRSSKGGRREGCCCEQLRLPRRRFQRLKTSTPSARCSAQRGGCVRTALRACTSRSWRERQRERTSSSPSLALVSDPPSSLLICDSIALSSFSKHSRSCLILTASLPLP